MIPPECFGDWKAAKAYAGQLAPTLGMAIGQGQDGSKLLFRKGQAPERFATWLALATHLDRIAADRPRLATAADANLPMARIVG